MAAPSTSAETGLGRRVLVALVIATTAAAVTAGVTLAGRPRGEAVVQRSEADAAPDRDLAAAASARRRAPLSEAATTSTADGPITDADPSLPAAAEALQRAAGEPGEPTPTF